MKHIEYFKLQAKNLFRDYQTKTPYIDEVHGFSSYKYNPKYFDIFGIIVDYDLDENNFTLMKAQHVIALMSGFEKWADLLRASEEKLELGKLLLEYRDNETIIDDLDWHVGAIENANGIVLDDAARLAVFKHFYLNSEDQQSGISRTSPS